MPRFSSGLRSNTFHDHDGDEHPNADKLGLENELGEGEGAATKITARDAVELGEEAVQMLREGGAATARCDVPDDARCVCVTEIANGPRYRSARQEHGGELGDLPDVVQRGATEGVWRGDRIRTDLAHADEGQFWYKAAGAAAFVCELPASREAGWYGKGLGGLHEHGLQEEWMVEVRTLQSQRWRQPAVYPAEGKEHDRPRGPANEVDEGTTDRTGDETPDAQAARLGGQSVVVRDGAQSDDGRSFRDSERQRGAKVSGRGGR